MGTLTISPGLKLRKQFQTDEIFDNQSHDLLGERYLQHLLLNLDAAHERSFAAPVWPSVDLKKLWSNSAGAWHCHGGEENKHSVSLQHLGVVML